MRDRKRVASVIKRLDIPRDRQDWLSLAPLSDDRFAHFSKYSKDFGEINQDNNLHGKGIRIYSNGDI